MRTSSRERAGYLILLFIAMIPAWAPLTRPGLPAWWPGALPALHLGALAHEVLPDMGTVLDSRFAYTVARLFRLIGMDDAAALKASLALGVMLVGLVVFLWARRLWGEKAGVLAALLVLYAPVFLSGLYVVGGVALPWLMLGLGLLGLSTAIRGGWRWAALIAGLALTVFNGVFLFQTSLAPTSVSLYQLFEFPWMWDTATLGLDSAPAWTPGLPLLALAIISVWLGWSRDSEASRESSSRKWMSIWAGVGALLLAASLLVPGDLALALILAGSLSLAVAAAGLLALAPVLQTPAIWAALLLLPVLAAGPALSPEFETYAIPEQPAAIFGDQQILLIDVGLDGSLAPGQSVTINALWQALQPIDFDYNIFIHIVDEAEEGTAFLCMQVAFGYRDDRQWRHHLRKMGPPPDTRIGHFKPGHPCFVP